MSVFLRNTTFHGILLDALFSGQSQEWSEVSALMQKGIEQGVVRPLSTTLFQRDSIEDAFRFMAQGKHIGKVVIQVSMMGMKEKKRKRKRRRRRRRIMIMMIMIMIMIMIMMVMMTMKTTTTCRCERSCRRRRRSCSWRQ